MTVPGGGMAVSGHQPRNESTRPGGFYLILCGHLIVQTALTPGRFGPCRFSSSTKVQIGGSCSTHEKASHPPGGNYIEGKGTPLLYTQRCSDTICKPFIGQNSTPGEAENSLCPTGLSDVSTRTDRSTVCCSCQVRRIALLLMRYPGNSSQRNPCPTTTSQH